MPKKKGPALRWPVFYNHDGSDKMDNIYLYIINEFRSGKPWVVRGHYIKKGRSYYTNNKNKPLFIAPGKSDGHGGIKPYFFYLSESELSQTEQENIKEEQCEKQIIKNKTQTGGLVAQEIKLIDIRVLTILKSPLGKEVTIPNPKISIVKIYVPTKFGGKISLKTTLNSGGTSKSIALFYKNGSDIDELTKREIMNGNNKVSSVNNNNELKNFDVSQDKYGWYYVRVEADVETKLENSFIQEAIAKDSDGSDLVPWNFWYFPFSDLGDPPHGWDNPGPFTRFDSKFGTNGYTWEKDTNNHYDPNGERWWGHCHGAVRAAIFFKQPTIPSPNPQGFKQEDLELFATEYCMKNCKRTCVWSLPGSRTSPLHSEIPAKGPGLTNAHAGSFHKHIVDVILVKKEACYMDLRSEEPHGAKNIRAIWNQTVYKFKAVFTEHDYSSDDEKDIFITNTITANEDNNGVDNGNPETGDRIEKVAQYRVVYKTDGTIDESDSRQDWESMKYGGNDQLAPRYIYRVINFSEDRNDGNTEVKYTHLDQLGIKRRKKYETISTPNYS